MQQFINTFFSVKFMPALLIASLVFMRNCQKRKLFWLRLVVSFVFVGFIAWGFWNLAGIAANALGSESFLFTIPYVVADLIFFFLVAGFNCICFRCCFYEAVLYTVGSWASEHLANSLCVCIAIWSGMPGWMYRDYSLAYFLTTLGVYTAVYIGIFVITKFLGKDRVINLDKKKLILPSLCLFFTGMVLTAFTPYTDGSPLVVIKLYAVACSVIILCLIFSLFETGKYRVRVEVLEQLDKKMSEQYEISRDTVEVINTKCHDLKKYVGSALANKSIFSEEELEELNRKLNIYDSVIKTGNKTFDVVLSEKSFFCEKHDIKLTVIADTSRLGFLTDMEIYSLFTNIMDNALEAVSRLEEGKRTISLSVKCSDDFLVVHEENFFSDIRWGEDGQIRTSKPDRINHGYGLVSIRRIAEKYGGTMSVSAKDVFKLSILIPIPKKSQPKI